MWRVWLLALVVGCGGGGGGSNVVVPPTDDPFLGKYSGSWSSEDGRFGSVTLDYGTKIAAKVQNDQGAEIATLDCGVWADFHEPGHFSGTWKEGSLSRPFTGSFVSVGGNAVVVYCSLDDGLNSPKKHIVPLQMQLSRQ